ncbi:MAG: FliH/SctL family protein [Paracoccaceae bacterium]
MFFADLENKQQEALQAFQTIIDNIKKKEAVDKTDLTQSILRVITRLASERAGSVIDEHPETFKNKIISLADKIKQESKNLILNLNPRDAHLLKNKLAESLSDKKIEIRENSELFRGDFIFQAGAVEIGDLISEQIEIVEKEKTATTYENEPEIDKNTIEKKEVGSDDKGSSKQTGEGNLSEINNDK